MKLITNFIIKSKVLVFLMLAVLLIQSFVTLMIPTLIGELIDDGIKHGNQDLILRVGIKMAILCCIGIFVGGLSSYLAAKIAADFGYETRNRMMEKVQEITVDQLNNETVSGITTRLIDDVENIQQIIVLTIQLIIPAPFLVLISLVLAYKISVYFAISTLLITILFIFILGYILNKSIPFSRKIQAKLEKIVVVTREFYTGMNMIKAFTNESFEEERTNRTFQQYADILIKSNRIFSVITPLAFFLMGISYAIILWICTILFSSSEIQIGSAIVVVEYSLLALMYIMTATMVFVSFPKGHSSLLRVKNFLNLEANVEDNDPRSLTNKKQITRDGFKNNEKYPVPLVSFDQVTFSYDHSEEAVLEKINFTINRGETIAIVGGTGSGKSTIAKLLLRLIDPVQGQITINGKEINKLKQRDLREYISYVPQKSFLFRGTIKENLKMGNDRLSKQNILDAMKVSKSFEFVNSLSEKLDSWVSPGGTNFSGGQRQRLCIARALLKKDSEIFLFDDSFSALDYKTDYKIRKGMEGLLRNKTLIIIAQRLNTIKNADKIIVLDKGAIVGQGTHKELLKNNLTYQEFAKSQSILE